MKIARFRSGGGPARLGRVDVDLEGGDGLAAGTVTDISDVPGVGTSLRAILPELDALRDAIGAADGPRYALADVVLEAPVDEPQKYLGIGMNYAAHAEEARQAGIPIPTSQLWFNKQVSCIVGPHDDVVKPAVSDELDYEIELAVVIGKRCKDVTAADARSVIGGYLVANDVSVRDWLAKRSPTFTLGKSFDTHGPLGPWLTTDDEIADPLDLRMRLTVNGEVRQDWRTDDMIDDIYAQIAYLSQVMTLMPGDVLATGTPAGIGAPTGRFLKVGDVVRAEIEGLGAIENTVVEPPAAASTSTARGPDVGRRVAVEIPGFAHANPVPAASRIGPFLASGVLTGRDPETGEMPASLDAQCAIVFRHVRALLTAAGGSTDDILKMTFWLADYRDRDALNREWAAMFPDAADRPARQVVAARLDGGALVHGDLLAVLD